MVLRILIILFAFSAYGQELKIITEEELIKANPSPERQKLVKFLVHQFDGKSVSQAELDNLWNDLSARHKFSLIRFQIINQKLYADAAREIYTKLYYNQLINYLQKLLVKYKIEDVDFILSEIDELDEPDKIPNVFFAMSKNLKRSGEERILLIPDAFMLKDSWKNLSNTIEISRDNYLWKNKLNKIFWRGATTGGTLGDYQLINFDKLPRLTMVTLSKLYPDLIDAKFSHFINTFTDFNDIWDILFAKDRNKISEVEHLKYKYLISIDGYTCAWQRVPLDYAL